MGLFDFLFGNSETNNKGSHVDKTHSDFRNEFSDDDYYNYHFDNALSGDPESIQEMRETFGEDWFE
jgi:hypothetical protein